MKKYSFKECLARPGQLLSKHLEAVARNISTDPKSIEYIYGLSHDLGKAYYKWQEIIRKTPEAKKPTHSISSAAIFFSIAQKHFSKEDPELIVELTLDILGHHGPIKDFAVDVWDEKVINEQISNMDLKGIGQYIYSLTGLSLPDISIEKWGFYIQSSYVELYKKLNDKENEKNNWLLEKTSKKQLAKLVEGDRVDAARFAYPGELVFRETKDALNNLKSFCADQKTPLSQIRQYCQDEAVKTLKSFPNEIVYKLDLPTGYGKTMTSLRVALEASMLNNLKRIIYIAPYVGVLSQSTEDIRNATKLSVLEHHHLSFLQKNNEKYTTNDKLLVFDNWHEKIVTSTFNKVFEAIFPRRANDLLRRSGMKNSFIILDEPQIVDYRDWELFLSSVVDFAKRNNSQILLCTATCPDVSVLDVKPIMLVEKIPQPRNRYVIRNNNKLYTKESIADKIANEQHSNLCVILDTIRDAYEVYDSIRGIKKKKYFLSGLMNSHHKAEMVENLKKDLAQNKELIMISTQSIEMGMDLSFRKIIRNLSTIPSIVQTAGRVNRQGEGELAELEIIKYEGKGRNIYPKILTRLTDELLPQECFENESVKLVNEFYLKLAMSTNAGWEELLENIALTGNWSEIRNKKLFREEMAGYDVFIPYPNKPKACKDIMDEFGLENSSAIYDLYLSQEWRGFDFVAKRKFFSLLMSFTVSLWPNEAIRVVRNTEDGILRLIDDNMYSKETGLSSVRAGEVECGIFY